MIDDEADGLRNNARVERDEYYAPFTWGGRFYDVPPEGFDFPAVNRFSAVRSCRIHLQCCSLRTIARFTLKVLWQCLKTGAQAIYIDSRLWNAFLELGGKVVANLSKINPKSVQNRSKIDSKSIKNRPDSVSEALLDPLAPILGTKMHPKSIFRRFWDPFWGHFGVIFPTQIRSFCNSLF